MAPCRQDDCPSYGPEEPFVGALEVNRGFFEDHGVEVGDRDRDPRGALTWSDCMLCRAERVTPWHFEDEECWVTDCLVCRTPMIVWRLARSPRRRNSRRGSSPDSRRSPPSATPTATTSTASAGGSPTTGTRVGVDATEKGAAGRHHPGVAGRDPHERGDPRARHPPLEGLRALSKLGHLLDAIKFEHTVFALPFAYIAMLLAAGGWPGAWAVGWVTAAMVWRPHVRDGGQPRGRSLDRRSQSAHRQR